MKVRYVGENAHSGGLWERGRMEVSGWGGLRDVVKHDN